MMALSKPMIIKATIYKDEKCEYTNSNRYGEGPCQEPAPFLICFFDKSATRPDAMLWACEYHKNEQELEGE